MNINALYTENTSNDAMVRDDNITIQVETYSTL